MDDVAASDAERTAMRRPPALTNDAAVARTALDKTAAPLTAVLEVALAATEATTTTMPETDVLLAAVASADRNTSR